MGSLYEVNGSTGEINNLQKGIKNLKFESGTSFPVSPAPVQGQTFYRSDENKLYTYTGSVWQLVAAQGTLSADSVTNTELATDVLSIGKITNSKLTLDADGTSIITSTLDNATGNETALTLNYETNKATSGNDTGLVINQTDTLSPGTSNLLDLQVGGSSKVVVTNAGNMGIGTPTPGSYKLNIDGTYGLYVQGVTKGITLLGPFEGLSSVNNYFLGNVGIGTSSPLRSLHINSPTISCETVMSVADGLANYRNWNWFVSGGAGNKQNLGLRMLNDAGSAGTIDNVMNFSGTTGYVGIGKSVPEYPLDVAGTIDCDIYLRVNGRRAIEYPGTDTVMLFGTVNAGDSLQLRSGGVTRLAIDTAGNVGIGTSSPGYKLTMLETSAIGNTAGNVRDIARITGLDSDGYDTGLVYRLNRITDGTGHIGVGISLIHCTQASHKTELSFYQGNVGIGTSSPQSNLHVSGVASANSLVTIGAGTGLGTDKVFRVLIDISPETYGLCLLRNGNVGIGTSSPTYQLQLSTDSAAKPTTNLWTVASDSRVKKDITPFIDGLDIINKLNPISYKLNGKAGLPLDAPGISIIAQDVKDIMPYTVHTYKAKLEPTDAEDTELFDFNGSALIWVLVNAVKELSARIEILENK